MKSDADEITQLLHRWSAGDAHSLDQLLPHIYSDLRRIAASELRGKTGYQTLQPTALINDMFVRLLGAGKLDITNRKHFFATAAKLMRQLLTDRARAKLSEKHGGGLKRVDSAFATALPFDDNGDFLALDDALEKLSKLDPRLAEIVELRYFAGLAVSEVANLHQLDERTIYRDWAIARAWLKQQLE
jgi:RNA polymerase sigma factor (TIGR02999 family)